MRIQIVPGLRRSVRISLPDVQLRTGLSPNVMEIVVDHHVYVIDKTLYDDKAALSAHVQRLMQRHARIDD